MRRAAAVLVALGVALGLATVPASGSASGSAAAVTTSPVVWLCKPGTVNDPCEIPLDTTNQRADGTSTVTRPARKPASQRPVDCFYVYPTVSNQVGLNATKAKDPEILSIAKYQAARFSSVCRMYAPVYREVPVAAVGTLPLGAPTAYADVKQAFLEYLQRYSSGRGFVLIGHSQGTLMLRKLIRELIDTNPALRQRLVGALLMGGNVITAKGSDSGGDFAKIPLCRAKGQARCVVAYSTFSANPLLASFFGNASTDVLSPAIGLPSGGTRQVACTDPGVLAGSTAPVGVLVPSEPFAPGAIRTGIQVTAGMPPPKAPTAWVQTYDRYQGSCRTINGASVYRYDPTTGSRRLHEFPPLWGTHLVDMNLGLDRLVTIARLQSAAWLAGR